MKPVQIFISHTKKDKQFCDIFDTIVARVGIKAFRSELETINPPAWRIIKQAISDSVALFFLVGRAFIISQRSDNLNWRFTQNWIAYEIGAACEKGIDVWIVRDVNIFPSFPLPYVNNYFIHSLRSPAISNSMRGILETYEKGRNYSHLYAGIGVRCPHCRIEFNLYGSLHSAGMKCPCCLKGIPLLKSRIY